MADVPVDDPIVQINLRVPRSLRGDIDARAALVGRSRNNWLEAAIRWALTQPVRETATRRTEKT